MKRVIFVLVAVAALATTGNLSAKEPVKPDDRTVEQLVAEFDGEFPMRRAKAAKALGRKGPEVLPVIMKALADDDWRVRRSGLDALGVMEELPKSAMPVLIKLMEDEHFWVREASATLLGRYGDEGAPAAKGLAKLCVDPVPWVRYNAIGSLQKVTKDKDILLPAAVALLYKPDTYWRPRGSAVGVISKYGEGYKPAIPALLHIVENPSEGMWCAIPSAMKALYKFDAPKDKLEKAILKLGHSPKWSSRRVAISLMVEHMADSKEAISLIKNIAENDPHRKVRQSAEGALKKLEDK